MLRDLEGLCWTHYTALQAKKNSKKKKTHTKDGVLCNESRRGHDSGVSQRLVLTEEGRPGGTFLIFFGCGSVIKEESCENK